MLDESDGKAKAQGEDPRSLGERRILRTFANERANERTNEKERGMRRARGGYGRLVPNERGPRELAGIVNERLGTRLVSLT